ncbi:MAG: hypothetical protein CSB15_00895 [Clostridiales bacterium]|nr:MAG: hypothetical protein CSB15_00895 [Clostridiales bacterium]
MNNIEITDREVLNDVKFSISDIVCREIIRSYKGITDFLKKRADIKEFEINNILDNSFSIYEKIGKAIFNSFNYSCKDMNNDLEFLENSVKELMAIISFIEINNKAYYKLKYNVKENQDNLNFSADSITEIIHDIRTRLGDEELVKLLGVTLWSNPIRLHRNKLLSYLENRLEKTFLNSRQSISKKDAELYVNNILAVIFPESIVENAVIFKDFSKFVYDKSFISNFDDFVVLESDTQNIYENLKKCQIYASYILTFMQELKYLLKSYIVASKLGIKEIKDFDNVKSAVKSLILEKSSFVKTSNINDDLDDFISSFENYGLVFTLFPVYLLTTNFFVEKIDDVYESDINADIFLVSKMYELKKGKFTSAIKTEYKNIMDMLNLLNEDLVFSKYTAYQSAIDINTKRKFIKNIISDIDEKISLDNRLTRFSRINFIYALNTTLIKDKEEFFEKFMSLYQDAKSAEKYNIISTIIEEYQTYILNEK